MDIIPDSVTRLTVERIVTDKEMMTARSIDIFADCARGMAHDLLRKIALDCAQTKESFAPPGVLIRLDAYVISPAELNEIILRAREQGMRDGMAMPTRRPAGLTDNEDRAP